MRNLFVLFVSGCLLACLSACSSNKQQTSAAFGQSSVTGVLIDQACGTKMMAQDDPEKAASSHTKECATKEACAASGYAVITGKDMIKFDDNGNQLAKDFLAKTDKTDNLRVTVEGTRNGDMMIVTAINPVD